MIARIKPHRIIEDCLTFKHKHFQTKYSLAGNVEGEIVESIFQATARVSGYQTVFRFPSYQFNEVEIWTRSLSEAEAISKSQKRQFNDTRIRVVDRIGQAWSTFLEYNKGELVKAEAGTDKMVTMYPHRGFNFAVDLIAAAVESKKLPKAFRENIRRIAHITTLDDYMTKKEAELKEYPKISLDEHFNRWAIDTYRRPEYLPKNNIRN